ncbi:MAG: LysR family transcriptional regulator, partial [Variibacter sp.]|nr:LysR family transcriptional regulator [Variibacter sp.]
MARALASLSQVETFLTLVEQGSLAGVSARLGLGPSTVSAHVKAMEDELGHRLFDRMQDGMAPTPMGQSAYARLRPLLARIAFSVRYLRARSAFAPEIVGVAMPADFPGSTLDVAFGAAAQVLQGAAPHVCLVPSAGDPAEPRSALRMDYAQAAPRTPGTIRDRWVIVRTSAASGWRARPLPLSALAGHTLLTPRLPAALSKAVAGLAAQAGLRINDTGLPSTRLLSQAGQFQSFCMLVPAGLLGVGAPRRVLEFALLEAGPFDPVLEITGDADAAVVEVLRGEIVRVLSAPQDMEPPVRRPAAEGLSLKHARSFLALYEEGNVGRAARRLCVVQPALTVQLRQIEERVDGPLFLRTRRGLRANARATALYAMLHPLIGEFDAAVQALRAVDAPRVRPLRVGLMPALDDESLITESFIAALEKWTGEREVPIPQVVEAYSNTLMRWVHEGRVDFALIDQVVEDAMVEVDAVATDLMAVVVSARSDLLPPGPVALRQVAKLPLVLPSRRHGLRMLLSNHLKDIGLTVEPKAEVDSMAAALRLVQVAPYATVLPLGSVYKSHRRRLLRVHEISQPAIIRHICLARTRRT